MPMEMLYALAAAMLLLGPLALAALVVIWRLGCLRPDTFKDAPFRPVGLTGMDLLIALIVHLGGMVLLGQVVHLVPLPVHPTWGAAVRALLVQVGSQLPVVLYVLLRSYTGPLYGPAQPDGWRHLGLRAGRGTVAMAAVALVLSLPVVLGINVLAALVAGALGVPLPEHGHSLLPVLRDADSILALGALMFSILVLAPVLEELIFRGLVQTSLLEMMGAQRRWPVLIVAACIFAVVHMTAVPVQNLPGLFAFGLALGWVYEKSGSLLPSILLHAGFNAVNSGWVLLAES